MPIQAVDTDQAPQPDASSFPPCPSQTSVMSAPSTSDPDERIAHDLVIVLIRRVGDAWRRRWSPLVGLHSGLRFGGPFF